MRIVNYKDVGPPNTPQEIKRARRQASDYLRKSGQPIVHMHYFSPLDERQGKVVKCPLSYQSEYDHTRTDCPVCFGVGFVSVENYPDQWIADDGTFTTEPTDTPRPLYGGFGPPTLTWMVLPDASIDVYMFNDAGVLTRTQQAKAFAPWNPEMGDNDLLVAVAIGASGSDITGQGDRWQMKMVDPQTVRGFGNRVDYQQFKVGQTFEMNLIPSGSPFWEVPIGGADYGGS